MKLEISFGPKNVVVRQISMYASEGVKHGLHKQETKPAGGLSTRPPSPGPSRYRYADMEGREILKTWSALFQRLVQSGGRGELELHDATMTRCRLDEFWARVGGLRRTFKRLAC